MYRNQDSGLPYLSGLRNQQISSKLKKKNGKKNGKNGNLAMLERHEYFAFTIRQDDRGKKFAFFEDNTKEN